MCKKHIVITGGNSGIGFQAALQASLNKNCLVTIICRNKERAEKACDDILKTGGRHIDYITADLSNMQSVKDAVNVYKSRYETLDVLINNAADFDITNKKRNITADGFETQFAVNVVSPYLLSCLLKDYLINSLNGKIINMSSRGLCLFPFIKLDFNNLNGEKYFNPAKTYYQNKLALLLFSKYLSDKQTNIKIQAVRVTNVKIDITRYPNISSFLKYMYKIKSLFSISPYDMALVYNRLAFNDYNGFLFDEKCREVKVNKYVYNISAQKKLYEYLSSITGATFL